MVICTAIDNHGHVGTAVSSGSASNRLCHGTFVAYPAPQGFPVRLAPGAPNTVRLLKGHPFSQQDATGDGDAADDGQVQQLLLTQLAPEQQLVPAQVLSGEQLPAFKVQSGGEGS